METIAKKQLTNESIISIKSLERLSSEGWRIVREREPWSFHDEKLTLYRDHEEYSIPNNTEKDGLIFGKVYKIDKIANESELFYLKETDCWLPFSFIDHTVDIDTIARDSLCMDEEHNEEANEDDSKKEICIVHVYFNDGGYVSRDFDDMTYADLHAELYGSLVDGEFILLRDLFISKKSIKYICVQKHEETEYKGAGTLWGSNINGN